MPVTNTLQPWPVSDFSGGITDNYYTAPPNCYSAMDNMFLDENGKPYTRPGMQCFTNRLPYAPAANRMSGIYMDSAPYGDPVFVVRDQVWGLNDSDGYTPVFTPTGNNALAGKGNTDLESLEVWRKQLIVASAPSTVKPLRVYCSVLSPRVLRGVTLGLPELAVSPTIIENYVQFTGDVASGNTTVSNLTNAASLVAGENIIFYDGVIFVTTHIVSVNVGAATMVISPAPSFTHVGQRMGMGGGTSNYIYAFHYSYQFTDYQGTIFEEDGPHVQVECDNFGSFTYYTTSISAIPVLVNTAYSSWDTSSVVIKIFRTQANGQTLYYVGQVTNGTTTYTDSTVDNIIVDNEVIYTDGGALDWDPPMVGIKYVTQVNDFFWYASDSKVTHSIQGAPGASPASYQQPLDQKIKGLANVIGFPILFCDRSIYRLDGVFDEFGNGGFQLREISKTAGCISNRGIVAIPGTSGSNGLVFPGNGGFYFTDGYQVTKISTNLNQRTEVWNNSEMVGAYDPIKNLVVWTINSARNAGIYPNDSCAVLHLNFGISDKSVFTTFSSQTEFYPTSLAFSNSSDSDTRLLGKMLIGTGTGYFLYLDPSTYTDPNIESTVSPASFTRKAIIYRHESLGMNLGDESNRKYCVELTAELFNDTDLAVQFLTRRDDEGPWQTFSEIRQDGALLWDISEAAWDTGVVLTSDLNHDWDAQPIIEGKRHFPSGKLRATRRQVGFTNAATWIARSDDQSTATTNVTTKTVTLNDAAKVFPNDCEDYYIYFNVDSYVVGYKIKTRTSDTVIVVYDPFATLPAGATHKWQIQGIRKNEICHLLSYTVWSDKEGTTQMPNRGVSGYVNA